MSWVNGSSLTFGSPKAHAKNKRLALIKRRQEALLRRQQAAERAQMDESIDALAGILDE